MATSHFKLVVDIPNHGRKIAQLINIHQVREDKGFSNILLSCQVINNHMNKKLSSVTEHLWGEVHSLKAPCERLPSALWEPIEWAPSFEINESEIRSGKKHMNYTHSTVQRNYTRHWLREWFVTYCMLLSTYNLRRIQAMKSPFKFKGLCASLRKHIKSFWFSNCLIYFQQQP